MATRPLKDILIVARQESHRMRHFYLGIEHLFIALLDIKNGLASTILADEGLQADYVIDAIRRKIGKGSRQRLWTGMPTNPRTETTLNIANDIALEQGRTSTEERDLLLAILDEGDNIPVRVLRRLGLDIQHLRHKAATAPAQRSPTQSFIVIEHGPNFSDEIGQEALFILRRMFHGYARIRIEQALHGGYSAALVLVVTPIGIDGREAARVVVKIGQSANILDEAQRYEHFVKASLPPYTARLEEKPTAPDNFDLAGLQYTLLTEGDTIARDLRAIATEWSGAQLSDWLHNRLFATFGATWWEQRRLYRFEVAQEYDPLLPPMLKLSYAEQSPATPIQHSLKAPLKRSDFLPIQTGDHVLLQNFMVEQVDEKLGILVLAVPLGTQSSRIFRVQLDGLDFSEVTYFRGEVVDAIVGRVMATRQELVEDSLRALQPPFGIHATQFNLGGLTLPNPVQVYAALLDRTIISGQSIIHGDLHLGNILVSGQLALLIDFARTREGHTLFDWATLEMSLLAERLAPLLANTWDASADALYQLIAAWYSGQTSNDMPTELQEAVLPILAIRRIAARCLSSPRAWGEYYLALAFVCFRTLDWNSRPVPTRRLLYLVAAAAFAELLRSTSDGTLPPDATDFMQSYGESR